MPVLTVTLNSAIQAGIIKYVFFNKVNNKSVVEFIFALVSINTSYNLFKQEVFVHCHEVTLNIKFKNSAFFG